MAIDQNGLSKCNKYLIEPSSTFNRRGKYFSDNKKLYLHFHRQRERRRNWLWLLRSPLYGSRADDNVAVG